ncbi:MAG: Cytoplasmic glyoxalase II [Watsoniomyces obsoletus]|nr:MAG: Cytoplasmic glyoxalase II [Watsoniomyces obsoletus]
MSASQASFGPRTFTPNSPSRFNTLRSYGHAAAYLRDDDEAWRLTLKHIVGATTSTPTGFDSCASTRSIAYTAGGIAVVVSLDEDLRVSQRFFRARPTATPLASFPPPPAQIPGLGSPTTDGRRRGGTPLRDVALTSIGGLPSVGDWDDSPTSKTWTARERVKSASCISFSADGRYLAVGEVKSHPSITIIASCLHGMMTKTGYQPRVLIFSTAVDSVCEIPLAILSEHTHGVAAVAFSPDSRYMASLGTSHDGFLHLWSFNSKTGSAKLYSSSKCTSFVRILTWMSKDSFITAGTRHVKLWRLEEFRPPSSPSKTRNLGDGKSPSVNASPGPKLLPGRNCLLGGLVDRTFTCAARITADEIILCTDKGEVCRIEQSEGNQRVIKVAQAEYGINCIAVDPEGEYAWLGGNQGEISAISISQIMSSRDGKKSPVKELPSPTNTSSPLQASSVTGIAATVDFLVVTDSGHAPRVLSIIQGMGEGEIPAAGASKVELAAPGGALLGASVLALTGTSTSPLFFTWSAEGQILFWDVDGNKTDEIKIELEQFRTIDDDFNELKVVRASPDNEFYACGDKFGVLRILDGASKKTIYEDKAHSAEITDIRVCRDEETTLVATCGRDRMVQLFCKQQNEDKWELVQTFEEHKASVTGVLFIDEGDYLLSCAGDRTVAVRKLVKRSKDEDGDNADKSTIVDLAYIPHRTLTLKSAPVSMINHGESVFISTTDRTVYEFEFLSGRCIRSFRAVDTDGMDAVIMDKLAVLKTEDSSGGGVLVAGVSSTDKSIRIYDIRGNLVCREWGHTEGVTGLAVLQSGSWPSNSSDEKQQAAPPTTMLISTGADGTIMLWDLTRGLSRPSGSTNDAESTSSLDHKTQEMISTKKPMRKVLSRSGLAQFQKAATYFSTPTISSSSSSNSSAVTVMTGGVSVDTSMSMSKTNSGYHSSTLPRTLRGKSSRLGLNGISTSTTPNKQQNGNITVNDQERREEDMHMHTPTPRNTNHHVFGNNTTPTTTSSPLNFRKGGGGGGTTNTNNTTKQNNRPGIHARTRTKSTGNISSSPSTTRTRSLDTHTPSQSQSTTVLEIPISSQPQHQPLITNPTFPRDSESVSFSNPFSENDTSREFLLRKSEDIIQGLRNWRELFRTSSRGQDEEEEMVLEGLRREMTLTLKEMRRKSVGNDAGASREQHQEEEQEEWRDEGEEEEEEQEMILDERNLKVLLDPDALSKERSRIYHHQQQPPTRNNERRRDEEEEGVKTNIILPRRVRPNHHHHHHRHRHHTDPERNRNPDGIRDADEDTAGGTRNGNTTTARLSSSRNGEEYQGMITERLLREYSDRLVALVEDRLVVPVTPTDTSSSLGQRARQS